jgi:hypothetical protein
MTRRRARLAIGRQLVVFGLAALNVFVWLRVGLLAARIIARALQ